MMDVVDRIIAREGGAKITRDPNDPGGITKYGISKKSHPTVDVENLTYDQAKDIYINEYYLKPGIQQLPEELQEIVLDFGVHSGPATAILYLQKLLGVPKTGFIGKSTLQAAYNITNFPLFIDAFRRERALFLARQVEAVPSKLRYLIGWLNRALSV